MSILVNQDSSKAISHADGHAIATPTLPSQQIHISTEAPASEKKELTIHDILAILKRRKWSILIPLIVTLAIAILYTLSTPPSYRANAVVQIERDGINIYPEGGLRKTGAFSGNVDPFFRTSYEMLKSRSLATKVIDELDLRSILVPPKKEGLISSLTKSMGLSGSKASVPVLTNYTELFKEKLLVQAIDDTHLVKVTYEGPSAENARAVVTSLLNNYIRIQIESQSETGKYAKDVLSKQLAEARKRLANSEKKLNTYASEKGIFAFDDTQSRHLSNFQSLDAALVAAENRRIEAESLYTQMKRVGSVSTVLTNPVITSLKARLVGLEGDYQEMLKTFKPNYPDMQRLNQQIGNAKSKLNAEMANIERSMKADYLAAKNQESRIRSELKKFNTKMHNLQDSSLDYNTLKREVETNGQVFNQLLQRLEEVNVASATNTSSISIVEPAVAPLKRYKPKPKMNIALGLISGLILGLGIAFLREALDQKITSNEQLQRISGLPVLGMLPRITRSMIRKKQDGMIPFQAPSSAAAEAFRILSTNLRFMSGKDNGQVILVTSVRPEEGKSTAASNIASTYVQMGMKVLLVDADIRNASLHTKLKIPNKKGLTNYLKGEIDLVGITQPIKSVSGLYTITAGEYMSNPVGLLAHERMSYLTTQGAKIFDMVIIDSPPVLGFADSLILSSLASSTVIVAKEDSLNASKVKSTLEHLGRVRNNVLGFLIVKSKNDLENRKEYSKYHKKAKKEARLALKKHKYA